MTAITGNDPEKLEGCECSQSASWGDYPIDTLLMRNEACTVHEILLQVLHIGPKITKR